MLASQAAAGMIAVPAAQNRRGFNNGPYPLMTDLSTLTIAPGSPILDAIQAIDRNSEQIALVTSEDNVLLGTVTDGDIRRGILRGLPLSTPVSEVMNRHPRTIALGTSPQEMMRLMRVWGIIKLPIVDAKGRLRDYLSLTAGPVRRERPNRVVLMAGGLGMRLRPLTETKPKPMLEIGGKPLLEISIDNFIRQGFRNFTISINHLGHVIRDYFGDGSAKGIAIDYIDDEGMRRGTAGSLRLIPTRLQEPMIVMNGDILTSINFHRMIDFHEESRSAATMAVYEHYIEVPFGVVKMKGSHIAEIKEKPTQHFFINAGIYVLDGGVVDLIPTDAFFDMPSLFQTLISQDRPPSAFPIWEQWLDIGHPKDLERAETVFNGFFFN